MQYLPIHKAKQNCINYIILMNNKITLGYSQQLKHLLVMKSNPKVSIYINLEVQNTKNMYILQPFQCNLFLKLHVVLP